MNGKNVAVDGPAGVGKSTVGKKLAGELSFLFAESGKLYRALAYAKLNRIPFKELEIFDSEGAEMGVKVGGRKLKGELSSNEISDKASKLARQENIRELVTKKLREFAKNNDIVIEGRDIGTVVLPSAELKIFLEATPKARAKRRKKQTEEEKDLVSVIEEIKKRDKRDKEREFAPLKPADDTIIIDTTNLTEKETVHKALELARKNLPK